MILSFLMALPVYGFSIGDILVAVAAGSAYQRRQNHDPGPGGNAVVDILIAIIVSFIHYLAL